MPGLRGRWRPVRVGGVIFAAAVAIAGVAFGVWAIVTQDSAAFGRLTWLAGALSMVVAAAVAAAGISVFWPAPTNVGFPHLGCPNPGTAPRQLWPRDASWPASRRYPAGTAGLPAAAGPAGSAGSRGAGGVAAARPCRDTGSGHDGAGS